MYGLNKKIKLKCDKVPKIREKNNNFKGIKKSIDRGSTFQYVNIVFLIPRKLFGTYPLINLN